MMAANAGVVRHIKQLTIDLAHRVPDTESGWETQCEGCAAELAVAKALGLYPTGLGEPLSPDGDTDVAGIQVRRRSSAGYELYLFRHEKREVPWVLVTGRMPNFELQGWIMGSDAMVPDFWVPASRTGGFPRAECYVVPNYLLNGPESLSEALEAVA